SPRSPRAEGTPMARRRLAWLLAVATSCVWLAGCSSSPSVGVSGQSSATQTAAYEKGRKDATAAVAAGKLIIREYPPLPSPAEHGEYIRLLKERCGVGYEVPSLPPGVAEADFIEEVRGWNDVMQAEIRRKFGPDIFNQLNQDARKAWQARAGQVK